MPRRGKVQLASGARQTSRNRTIVDYDDQVFARLLALGREWRRARPAADLERDDEGEEEEEDGGGVRHGATGFLVPAFGPMPGGFGCMGPAPPPGFAPPGW